MHELAVKAFMDNPDAPRPGNPIHSTGGGQEYGYRSALVGGVDVYGWGTRLIRQVLGNEWLSDGWVEVAFRRPVYPEDDLTVRLDEGDDGRHRFDIVTPDGLACIKGFCGLGRADWLHELHRQTFVPGEPAEDPIPVLTLANAPVGQLVKPLAIEFPVDEHADLVRRRQPNEDETFLGPAPLVHPALLAGLMTRLMHHSFDYGPAIHAATMIQHLQSVYAGQPLVVTGFCQRAYERKGHHYYVSDGTIWSADALELVRLRHTAIFSVAKRQ